MENLILNVKKYIEAHPYFWASIFVLELVFIIYSLSDRVRNVFLKMFFDNQNSFQWGSVTAIAAVLAIIYSWQSNNKNIKANLVSKARIEWIQNVRNETSELIALYYSLFSIADFNSTQEIMIRAKEKSERLILYFGPVRGEFRNSSGISISSDNKIIVTENVTNILKNELTNTNKNEFIIKYISLLTDYFFEYHNNILNDKVLSLQGQKRHVASQLFDFPEQEYREVGFWSEEAGEEILYQEPKYINVEAKKQEEAIEKQITKILQPTNEFKDNLSFLRDVMRIYLKVEWSKAKNGK